MRLFRLLLTLTCACGATSTPPPYVLPEPGPAEEASLPPVADVAVVAVVALEVQPLRFELAEPEHGDSGAASRRPRCRFSQAGATTHAAAYPVSFISLNKQPA